MTTMKVNFENNSRCPICGKVYPAKELLYCDAPIARSGGAFYCHPNDGLPEQEGELFEEHQPHYEPGRIVPHNALVCKNCCVEVVRDVHYCKGYINKLYFKMQEKQPERNDANIQELCGFCDSDDIAVIKTPYPQYACICRRCGFTTGYFLTRAEAIKSWNERCKNE